MSQSNEKTMFGLLAGSATGVFWGLPFLVPQVLKSYSPSEIAFGRFFFFGVVSLFFLPRVLRILKAMSTKELIRVVLLSASGFWLYSSILFWGIQHTDGVIASLILGLLPITIPLFTPGRKYGGVQFYLGLTLILLGLFNLFLFPVLRGNHQVRAPSLFGFLALIICLALWTAYAIANSRFLRHRPWISKKDFSSVMGIFSLIFMAPIFASGVHIDEFVSRVEFPLYLICSLGLGFGSSWIANWLWNIASFYCPSEISGTLLVTETIFGLIYSFAFEHRLPAIYESGSILFCICGVLLAVTAQLRSSR